MFKTNNNKKILFYLLCCIALAFLAPLLATAQGEGTASPGGKQATSPAVEGMLPDQGEVTELQIREKILTLIETELAEAYSFTTSSTHRLPHFEVLDRLYPKWHHGNPAAARQFWVNAGYRTFIVHYRADYVYVVNDVSAKVSGKRLVIWNEDEEGPDYTKFWPFQLWAALPKRTHRDDTYLSAVYPMRYKMKLTVNEKGEWIIAEERLFGSPEMLNNLKNHCLYEKQLKDWGLKNDCNKKLLSQ